MEQRTRNQRTDDRPAGSLPWRDSAASRIEARWDAATADATLVEGMCAGEERAYSEFVRRWQPLLSDAGRRQGIPAGVRDDLVTDVLVDAAATFGAGRPAPRAMAAYLVAALRNRARNAYRDAARRAAREGAAGEFDDGGASDLELVGRSPFPAPDAAFEPGTGELTNPVLATLATALIQGLAPDDRLLLIWVGHRVPHRDIAAWLGLGRAAVAKRVERLRTRLRQAAVARLAHADPATRAELLRFFQRADIVPRLLPPSPPPAIAPHPRPRPESSVPVRIPEE